MAELTPEEMVARLTLARLEAGPYRRLDAPELVMLADALLSAAETIAEVEWVKIGEDTSACAARCGAWRASYKGRGAGIGTHHDGCKVGLWASATRECAPLRGSQPNNSQSRSEVLGG